MNDVGSEVVVEYDASSTVATHSTKLFSNDVITASFSISLYMAKSSSTNYVQSVLI